MALKPYVRLVGGPKVVQALRLLAKNASTIGLKRGMLEFGREMHRAYLASVPIDTGLSQKWLRYGLMRSSDPNRVVLWIGPSAKSPMNRQNKRPFDYLHFPDHGTRYIRAQRFAGKAFRRGAAKAQPIIDSYIRRAIAASRIP